MGVLQKSFNQALTGATFLIQQTPEWQSASKLQEEAAGVKGLVKKATRTFNVAVSDPNLYKDDVDWATTASEAALSEATRNPVVLKMFKGKIGQKYEAALNNYIKQYARQNNQQEEFRTDLKKGGNK